MNHNAVIDHRHRYSALPTVPAGPAATSSTGRSMIEASTTKSEMVTTQTTMQYGHKAPIRYRLWKISQCTNTAPINTPTVNPTQYHWGKATFAAPNTPVTSTTVNPMMPSNELGNPRTEACWVSITEPQDTIGLVVQAG